MLEAATTGLTTVISWVGSVVTALTTAETGALYPLLGLLGLGIGVSAFFVGTKAIKSFTWGT